MTIWLLTLMLSFASPAKTATAAKTATVYICMGSGAYAYHKTSDCRYLRNCHKKIVGVTVKEATLKHRGKPCKPCYK